MAGIYIHIPFCKQACNYCNFYFSTSLHFKDKLIEALLKEIDLQKNYFKGETVSSIYFGGGTPSILSSNEIQKILTKIQETFEIDKAPEITLEGNPDDLNIKKLHALYEIGVNRLSIGTQSFIKEDLLFMNRVHSAKEAEQCIKDAGKVGFRDLSIDLIYGAPSQSSSSWKKNLDILQHLEINHLSSYALTVEENTPLYHLIRKGKYPAIDENLAAIHFEILQEWAYKHNWNHYEISNLSRGDNYSKHNTAYWQGKSYLGLGPAAHSFNGTSRQWNLANIKKYIDGINFNQVPFELEILSKSNQFNETIMTGLRTIWGVDKVLLAQLFPEYYPNFEKQVEQLNPQWVKNTNNKLCLSDQGRFYADGIAADLFVE
jgi:oxygen-independent coproporphyrinogen III oxidase